MDKFIENINDLINKNRKELKIVSKACTKDIIYITSADGEQYIIRKNNII